MLSCNMAEEWMWYAEVIPARALLLRYLGNSPHPTALTDTDDHEACAKLVNQGILVPCELDGNEVQLLDPLREREILRQLFPVRAFLHPTSLDAVVRQAIAHVTAAVDNGGEMISLNATTIRARFLEGLMLATDDKCCVCPELARVFPEAEDEATCPACQQYQLTDIYVGGRVEWGIQLRVRFRQPDSEVSSECLHLEPFSTRGRYGVLEVREHKTIVVDVDLGGGAGEKSGLCVRIEAKTVWALMPTKVELALASAQVLQDGSSNNKAGDTALGPPVERAKPWIAPFPRLKEPRTKLVGHLRSVLFDGEKPHRLVSLTGPHGIGKSGLVRLFQIQLDRDDVYYAWHKVDFTKVLEGIDPLSPVVFAMRRDARIDLTERRTDLLPATPATVHIVILDDAHRIFEETTFWSALTTAIHSWLPPNVRFIIAATTSAPASASELTPMLKEFPSIRDDAFVLSDDRARVYLMDESENEDGKSHGKLTQWPFKTDALAEVLIRAANGSIGLLERLVDAIETGDISTPAPSESALVRKFFMKAMSKSMAHALWGPNKLVLPLTSVSRCFALAAQNTVFASADEEPKIGDIVRLGLVKLIPDGTIDTCDSARCRLEFTSPCAKRLAMTFVSDGSGEECKMPVPTTPSSLVKSLLKMVGVLGPAAASASVVASFYERFIEALARRRNPDAEIYPELLDVLPPTARQKSLCAEDHGDGTTMEIDVCYVLDDRTRWGLQVRITDQDPQTLTAPERRFSAKRRYGMLRVDDFVEVDVVLAGSRACVEQEPLGSRIKQPKRMIVRFDPVKGRFSASGGGVVKRRGHTRLKRA